MWERLEDLWSWEGVLGEWEPCIAAGLPRHWLEPTGSLAIQTRLPDGRRLELVDEAGEGVALCTDTGEWLTVEHEERVEYTLNVGALAAALVFGLGLRARTGSLIHRAWLLGDWRPVAGDAFPMYLALSMDSHSLSVAVGQIAIQSPEPFIVLTGTTRHHRPEIVAAVQGRGGAMRSLDLLVDVDQAGVVTLRSPLKVALESFLNTHSPVAIGAVPAKRFPTPTGSTWNDVRMVQVDGHAFRVAVKDVARLVTYHDMGLEVHRSNKPDKQFELLKTMAAGFGKMTWDMRSASPAVKQRRHRLASALTAYFGIKGDPIPYDPHLPGWRTKFHLHPEAGAGDMSPV